MEVSRSSVDIHLERGKSRDSDPISKILSIIRDLSHHHHHHQHPTSDDSGAKSLPMDLVRDTVRGKGFSDEQLQQCLVAFDQCNIWSLNAEGTELRIFN